MNLLSKAIFSVTSLVQVADTLLVGFLLYQVYKFTKGSASIKILFGFVLLYLIHALATAIKMLGLTTLLGHILYHNVLIIAIIFQYEIRKLLGSLGDVLPRIRRKLLTKLLGSPKKTWVATMVTAIKEAAKSLGGSNTGGLIVLSNTADLKFYIKSGELLQGLVSKRLLLAIFNQKSPLHDGAVIIYKNTIVAARVILPVTEQPGLPVHFGLRHRAAIGMSEATDTLVLVISEETG